MSDLKKIQKALQDYQAERGNKWYHDLIPWLRKDFGSGKFHVGLCCYFRHTFSQNTLPRSIKDVYEKSTGNIPTEIRLWYKPGALEPRIELLETALALELSKIMIDYYE